MAQTLLAGFMFLIAATVFVVVSRKATDKTTDRPHKSKGRS